MLALIAACGSDPGPAQQTAPSPSASTTATSGVTPPAVPLSSSPTPSASRVVAVPYRLERRTTDAATAGFAEVVSATLADNRGWSRAGFRLVQDRRAPYVVVLAEPDEAQRLCLPYDVYRKYSCQNGPVVVLNAERWRNATPKWTGSLAAYRQLLVNHEVGHLLGLHHPAPPSCPRPGRSARVMSQQSTELNGGLPNPWPLVEEIERAARHDLPLAPPP